MNRKQKAAVGLGLSVLMLSPSAAFATETEYIAHSKVESFRVETQSLETVFLEESALLELSDTKPEIAVEQVTQEPVVVEEVEASVETNQSPEAAPVGSGNNSLLQAALNQVGIGQDCTDLVQNSLAALGYVMRRDQGGPDLGVESFTSFGVQVPVDQAQPGDIAYRGGHVFIILDPAAGVGVHGGWGGSTVVGNEGIPLYNYTIIRVG